MDIRIKAILANLFLLPGMGQATFLGRWKKGVAMMILFCAYLVFFFYSALPVARSLMQDPAFRDRATRYLQEPLMRPRLTQELTTQFRAAIERDLSEWIILLILLYLYPAFEVALYWREYGQKKESGEGLPGEREQS